MKNAVGGLILGIVVAVFALALPALGDARIRNAPIENVTEPGDGTIEFTAPEDWRCTNEGPCVTCWTVSDRGGDLVVTRGGRAEARRVPAGHGLSVCSP